MALPRTFFAFLTTALLAACSTTPAPIPVPATGTPYLLSAEIDALRAASCPEGVPYARATPLDIQADPVTLGGELPLGDSAPEIEFAGGWHLTSPDANFGGLSGLETFPSGNLLAVSDEGAFVWINLEDGVPASAHIAYMRGPDGQFLADKSLKDSEGLVLEDGLALVSYERAHRVDAFDLEGCGGAARAASLADLSTRPAGMGRDLENNGGAEGLALMGDEVLLGIETLDHGAPLARLEDGPRAAVLSRLQFDDGLQITGLDMLGETLYGVARNYTPLIGNTIEVFSVDMSGETPGPALTLFRLEPGMTVDNFEGLAVTALDGETTRIWLISDNNFSDRQRTLLMAFDLK